MAADTRLGAADDPDAPDPLLRPAWEDTPDETDADRRRRRGRARPPCPAKVPSPAGAPTGTTGRSMPWPDGDRARHLAPGAAPASRGAGALTLGSASIDLFKIVGQAPVASAPQISILARETNYFHLAISPRATPLGDTPRAGILWKYGRDLYTATAKRRGA